MTSTAALAVGGMAIGGISELVGNSMTMKASYVEANALRQEGDATYYDALMNAYQVENEAAQFKESQAMKYVMSGVSLQGTPMQVLDYTSKQSQLEIRHIKARGEKQRALAYEKAAYLESSARGKLLSSVGSTAYRIGSSLKGASEEGLFNHSGTDNLGDVLSNLKSLLSGKPIPTSYTPGIMEQA